MSTWYYKINVLAIFCHYFLITPAEIDYVLFLSMNHLFHSETKKLFKTNLLFISVIGILYTSTSTVVKTLANLIGLLS